MGRNAEVKTMFRKQTTGGRSNLRVNGHARTHTHISCFRLIVINYEKYIINLPANPEETLYESHAQIK